jgi:hypothetical protein
MVLVYAEGGKEQWAKVWHKNQDVFVRRCHVRVQNDAAAGRIPEHVYCTLSKPELRSAYAALPAAGFCFEAPSELTAFVMYTWNESLRLRPGPVRAEGVVGVYRASDDEMHAWYARLRRLRGALAHATNGNSGSADARAGRLKWRSLCAAQDVALVWRSCSRAGAEAAMSSPSVWTKDGGFFGRGHYTSLEASYAAEFADPEWKRTAQEAMLLFAIATANVRVITREDDYKERGYFSDHYSADPTASKAMLPTVDTYFVPVKPEESSFYGHQACASSIADAHEVIALDDAQLLPLAVVWYRTTS